MKNERELSVSSLPGVVPISKQLFSGSNSGSSDLPILGGGSEKTSSDTDGERKTCNSSKTHKSNKRKFNSRVKETSSQPQSSSSSRYWSNAVAERSVASLAPCRISP